MTTDKAVTLQTQPERPGKQPYAAPMLRALGDVRELTLGGSLGTGESGNEAVFKP